MKRPSLTANCKMIQAHIKEQPKITVTYFQPDEKKSGGAYVTITGSAMKIDDMEKLLILRNGISISICTILSLETNPF